MKLLKTFNFAPYPDILGVVIADIDAFKELLKEWEMPDDTISNTTDGQFIVLDNAYNLKKEFPTKYMIWIRATPKGFIHHLPIIHELQHAIFAILKHYDCTHADNTDELYAYYIGSLYAIIVDWHKEFYQCYYQEGIAWIFHFLKGERLDKAIQILINAYHLREGCADISEMDKDALYELNTLYEEWLKEPEQEEETNRICNADTVMLFN
jgi:hypothetical protein